TADGQQYMFAPGETDEITVRFTPTRSGSRRASMWISSSDSTVLQPGVSERGTIYLDVYGVGKVGLEARDVMLRPAVIDGAVSTGDVVVENTSAELVSINAVSI